MKYMILVLIVLSLTGCVIVERATARITGSSKMCVEGVSYIQFTSGASVQYGTDGKIVLCK